MKKNPVFRDYAKKILESYKDTPVIKVITGIRRAGKSFVLELLQESLLKTANADCVIKIDFEDFDNQEFLDLQFLYSFIKKRAEKTQKKFNFSFLDFFPKHLDFLRNLPIFTHFPLNIAIFS